MHNLTAIRSLWITFTKAAHFVRCTLRQGLLKCETGCLTINDSQRDGQNSLSVLGQDAGPLMATDLVINAFPFNDLDYLEV